MMNPNNEQLQDQGQTTQTQASHPTLAFPSEAATTAALASASAPATNSTLVGSKRKPHIHKLFGIISINFPWMKIILRQELSIGHGFRKYSNRLEPRFTVPSRVTVARDCYKLFVEEGKTIGKTIEKCLLGWGIENVFFITVDNASSNDMAVAYLKKSLRNWNGLVCDGDFLHVRCCAHILNLVVNDWLRDLHYFIGTIRNSVRYVRSSPAKLARFKGFVEKEKIETKSLVSLDIATRWNSMYLMLEHAMKFEKVFERMEDDDDEFTSHFREEPNRAGLPCHSDWRNASVFVQFLRVFYSITVRFSGSLYVTSNACFRDIAHV
ncbi:zinc finger BED domain-containing protein RICESLEEPER 2-like [Senna tora]|uniref:Zinc finger BED domain-containing protein RICESLEEPER 2-like n=1 Tax=Senna tora TaxID=362788 RepID=A0A834X007_9FABA|nr:zinc finger BED domain-containing protein RICESLEEPER 2-like [Senna tora]